MKIIGSDLNKNGLANYDMQVLLSGLSFPEGPAFARDGSLWAVELKGGCLIRYQDGKFTRYHVGGAPNGLAIDARGKISYCDALNNSVNEFDPASGVVSILAATVNGKVLTNPNDLAFDADNNLIFTCPGESRQAPIGSVCVLTRDGKTKVIASGMYFPNGLALTGDGCLIVAETYRHRLWKGDWDSKTCEWTNRQVWAMVGGPKGPGGPDGMAIDAEGYTYVAIYGTGKIKIVNHSGKILGSITMPGLNPTNCAFDPTGRLGFVVSEAENGQLIAVRLK